MCGIKKDSKFEESFLVGTTLIQIGATLFRRDDKIRTCDP